MVKQFLTLVSLMFVGLALTQAQTNDPVLFSVENNPVHVSEFKYIYTKTNQDKADFSRQSLQEYLDLYINFKLKVQKARDMHLDTVPDTKTELEGYRRQLANSYLVDREVTDKLVRELYDRMLQDVDVSYIFIPCDRNAPAADTLKAYKRAMNIYNMLQKGADFGQMAVDSSGDKAAKDNRGHLGYITAMFPDGYYEMEVAVYKAKPGQLLAPVRTNAGYNIVKVHGFRPARGEMEVAHILVRKGDTPEKIELAKLRIDSAYTALQAGMKWDDACLRFSEDKNSASKAGYIGYFGINRYQLSFEEAAFALNQDGEYTQPIETSIGWHIIKRISRKPIPGYEEIKRALSERVKRDSRSEVAKESMIRRIKKEGKFQENKAALQAWTNLQQDSVFHTFKWRPSATPSNEVLFSFGDNRQFTLGQFEEFCAKSTRERMRGKGYPVQETVDRLYKAWSDDTAMQYEETQLDSKYPEFRSLMREYEEGILLFEAAKRLVWDRANTDTLGLQAYFDANLSRKYNWDERAKVSYYTVKSDDPKILEKVRAYAATKPSADVLKKFNTKKTPDLVAVLENKYEKGKNKELLNMWTSGAMSDAKSDAGTKTASFFKVEQIMPPEPKAMGDARGYAVADYQDYLEKKWVEDLRKEYKVNVDQKVFDSLVK